jgi:hypothetical protein
MRRVGELHPAMARSEFDDFCRFAFGFLEE